MDEELFVGLLFGAMAVGGVASVIGWVRATHRIRRLENRLFAILDRTPASEPLAESVERLESQVERLAKGQAFLSDLIAGKRDRHLPPRIAPAPHVTPS
jgi:hypothetical protein